MVGKKKDFLCGTCFFFLKTLLSVGRPILWFGLGKGNESLLFVIILSRNVLHCEQKGYITVNRNGFSYFFYIIFFLSRTPVLPGIPNCNRSYWAISAGSKWKLLHIRNRCIKRVVSAYIYMYKKKGLVHANFVRIYTSDRYKCVYTWMMVETTQRTTR